MSSGQGSFFNEPVPVKDIILTDIQQEIYDHTCKYDMIIRMRTGSGKTYPILQFAQNHGLTIIVEPLTAICNDIAERAKEYDLRAHAVHGSMTKAEQFKYEQDKASGFLQLIVTTPETLCRNEYLLRSTKLVNIDEAHCMSMYGDMRPDYWRLATVLEQYKDVALALTSATITSQQIADIRLLMPSRAFGIYHESPWRDNLDIHSVEGRVTIDTLPAGKGIIFCQTIKEVLALQKELGPKCVIYHGKMSADMKQLSIKHYSNNVVSIIVATPALGMGISMDVQYVVHTNPAMNFEAQLQECGRAGRYSAGVCQIYHNNLSWKFVNYAMVISNPDEITIRKVYLRIGEMYSGLQRDMIPDMDYRTISCAVHILERLGMIDCTETEDETFYVNSGVYNSEVVRKFVADRKDRSVKSISTLMKWIRADCPRSIVDEYFNLGGV